MAFGMQMLVFYNYKYKDCMEKKSKGVMLSLEEQANTVFDQYRYDDEGLKPCAYFWKELVHAK